MQKDERVRTAIIEAAKGQFQRYGIAKTTMDEIARAAGKGKSTLYYYFADKDAILQTVLKLELQEYITLINAGVDAAGTIPEKLKYFFGSRFRVMREKATLYKQAFLEIRENRIWDQLCTLRKEYEHEEIRHLRALLETGIANGEIHHLTEPEIDAVSHIAIAALHGLEVNFGADFADDTQFETQVSILLDLLCRKFTN